MNKIYNVGDEITVQLKGKVIATFPGGTMGSHFGWLTVEVPSPGGGSDILTVVPNNIVKD